MDQNPSCSIHLGFLPSTLRRRLRRRYRFDLVLLLSTSFFPTLHRRWFAALSGGHIGSRHEKEKKGEKIGGRVDNVDASVVVHLLAYALLPPSSTMLTEIEVHRDCHG